MYRRVPGDRVIGLVCVIGLIVVIVLAAAKAAFSSTTDQGRRGTGPYCIALTAARYGQPLPAGVVSETIRSVGASTRCKPYERRTNGVPLKQLLQATSNTQLACIDNGEIVICPPGFGKGDKGDPGPVGPAGPQGIPGVTGAASASCTVTRAAADKGHVYVTIACPDGSSVRFREDTD